MHLLGSIGLTEALLDYAAGRDIDINAAIEELGETTDDQTIEESRPNFWRKEAMKLGPWVASDTYAILPTMTTSNMEEFLIKIGEIKIELEYWQ